MTGGVLRPPGRTRREAAAGAAVMDGSGEQPRGGGEAGGRRAGGGRAPSPPAPRSVPPARGRAISKHSRAETPGSGAASQQPPPSRGGPRLFGLRAPIPSCLAGSDPREAADPTIKAPGQARACRRHHFLVGGAGPPLCPLRPGVWMRKVFPQPPPPEECRLQAQASCPSSIRDSVV